MTNSRLHVNQVRNVLTLNPKALPDAESVQLYRRVYLHQLSSDEQALVFQAADEFQKRIPGLGPGSALELASKLGWYFIEKDIPHVP